MATPKGGNFGKVLEIDLSTQTYKTRPVSDEILQQYIGARGPRGLLRRDGVQGRQESLRRRCLRLRGARAPVRDHVRLPEDQHRQQEPLHGPSESWRVRRPPGERNQVGRLGRHLHQGPGEETRLVLRGQRQGGVPGRLEDVGQDDGRHARDDDQGDEGLPHPDNRHRPCRREWRPLFLPDRRALPRRGAQQRWIRIRRQETEGLRHPGHQVRRARRGQCQVPRGRPGGQGDQHQRPGSGEKKGVGNGQFARDQQLRARLARREELPEHLVARHCQTRRRGGRENILEATCCLHQLRDALPETGRAARRQVQGVLLPRPPSTSPAASWAPTWG